jgi:opacity protein-like surface antigen
MTLKYLAGLSLAERSFNVGASAFRNARLSIEVQTSRSRAPVRSTVRGRVGYAFDRALVYVTGGFAGGNVSDTILITQAGGVTDLLTGSTRRNGTTIGAGLEYLLAKNWSARAEYQYINLGSENLFGVSTAGVPVTTSAIKDRFNTVRLGLNYHFN